MKLINLRRVVFILSFALLTTQFSYGQEDNKTNILIDNFELVEAVKMNLLDGYIESLKQDVTKEDRIRLTEIENLLTDEEIRKRIAQTFNEFFTKSEIDELHSFVTSSVYDKLYKNPISIMDKIFDPFKDIVDELDRIAENMRQKTIEDN